MSKNRYPFKPSKEFKNAVAEAIDNNNFKQLNTLLNNSETDVIDPYANVICVSETKLKAETKPMEQTLSEIESMIQKGNEYIHKIHNLNDMIPGELISEKMNCTENLLTEIFARLKESPDQISKMYKLMNHYLPMTIKLLQGYLKFNEVRNPGTEVVAAKIEIEKTMDVVNEAFTELLNQLFQVDVIDITTDAQVLKTVLAKDGLTKSDFSEV